MRISYLAATTFILGASAFSSTAFAGCNSLSCNTYSGSNMGYGHTSSGHSSGTFNGHSSYSSTRSYGGAAHTGVTANCPTGTRPSSDGTCLVSGNGSQYLGSTSSHGRTSYGTNGTTNYGRSHGSTTYGPAHSGSTHSGSYKGTLRSFRSTTGAAVAPLGSYAGQTRATLGHMSSAEASHRYGSGSVSQSYSNDKHTIVPFSANTSNISTHRIAGMGANEVLTPTDCPVSVYNPNGGKVLGCYSVGKIAPKRITVKRTVTHRVIPHRMRVVRPIIYVRYPVPIAVPVPVYQQRMSYGCLAGYSTRYGQHWPGRPCGY